MDNNRLAFLGEDEDVTEAPTEEVAAQEPAAEAAPAEPAPITTGEPAAPPAAPQEPRADHIPIQAILDERDRRQAAERELAALRQQVARITAQQTAPKPVDLIDDPEGRLTYERETLQRQIMAAQMNQTLRTSRFMAEREFGADEVKEAYAYFDKNPALSQQLLDHPSPFHAAVEVYRRQKLADEIGSDPEGYKARLRAELEAELAAKSAPVQSTRPVVVPVSLASAPSAGRQEPTTRQDVPSRLRGVL